MAAFMNTRSLSPSLQSTHSSQHSNSSQNNQTNTSRGHTSACNTATTTPDTNGNAHIPAPSRKRRINDVTEESELQIRREYSRVGAILPNDGHVEIVWSHGDYKEHYGPVAKKARIAAAVGRDDSGHNGAQMLLDAAHFLELMALQETMGDKLTAAGKLENVRMEIARLIQKYDRSPPLDYFGRPSNKKPRKSTPVMDMRNQGSQRPIYKNSPGASLRDPARWGKLYTGIPWLDEKVTLVAVEPPPQKETDGIKKGGRKKRASKKDARRGKKGKKAKVEGQKEKKAKVEEKKEKKVEVERSTGKKAEVEGKKEAPLSKKRKLDDLKVDINDPPKVMEGRTRGKRAKS